MTHEELLNKMPLGYWYSQNELNNILRAIRAVVELHKVDEFNDCCNGCYSDLPCPTIQAIQKELK